VIKEINRQNFEYNSPIFRVLGVAAATDEEREAFLETMADQISSIAVDVGSIEMGISGVDFSDIERAVEMLKKDLYDVKLDIRKILERSK